MYVYKVKGDKTVRAMQNVLTSIQMLLSLYSIETCQELDRSLKVVGLVLSTAANKVQFCTGETVDTNKVTLFKPIGAFQYYLQIYHNCFEQKPTYLTPYQNVHPFTNLVLAAAAECP